MPTISKERMKEMNLHPQEVKYILNYLPVGAFVLIAKELSPEKVNKKIFIPEKSKEGNIRACAVGTIVSMVHGPRHFFADDFEWNRIHMFNVGDMVGFMDTTPNLSSALPYYDWGDGKTENPRFVTLNVCDINSVLFTNQQQRKEMEARWLKIPIQ